MNSDFGLYIHWPFCLKKCPYCDFNSYAFEHEPKIWVEALLQEMEQSAQINQHKMRTIFFGGGTPSLIPPKYIKELISKAKSLWPHEQDIEITLETNPSSLETHDLEKFLESGINRFSIGMQSLNNENLKFLGRLHSAEEARKIITHASQVCTNVSGDFIYALPSDSIKTWKQDLDNILALANAINLKHLSLYQLTIEENTAFEQAVRAKNWQPMDEDLQSVLYMHTHTMLNQLGWDFYEISNAARKTPYRSQHNLMYWNYEQYLGIGPGAHSRMIINNQRTKFHNEKSPYKWLDKINKAEKLFLDNKLDVEYLSEEEQFKEKLLMGLRLTDGIKIEENELHLLNQDILELLIKKHFIQNKGEIYSTPLKGRLKLNTILKMLLA